MRSHGIALAPAEQHEECDWIQQHKVLETVRNDRERKTN